MAWHFSIFSATQCWESRKRLKYTEHLRGLPAAPRHKEPHTKKKKNIHFVFTTPNLPPVNLLLLTSLTQLAISPHSPLALGPDQSRQIGPGTQPTIATLPPHWCAEHTDVLNSLLLSHTGLHEIHFHALPQILTRDAAKPASVATTSLVSRGNNRRDLVSTGPSSSTYLPLLHPWLAPHLNWKTTPLEQVYKQNHHSFVGTSAQMLLWKYCS